MQLRFCRFEYTQYGCVSRFPFGEPVEAHPHHSPHYHVIAHRCGYGDDVMTYCREHEFAHHFVEEVFHNRASQVISALALGTMLDGNASVYEEMAAQNFQRWLRAGERPITSGIDWDELKNRALSYLGFIAFGKLDVTRTVSQRLGPAI